MRNDMIKTYILLKLKISISKIKNEAAQTRF